MSRQGAMIMQQQLEWTVETIDPMAGAAGVFGERDEPDDEGDAAAEFVRDRVSELAGRVRGDLLALIPEDVPAIRSLPALLELFCSELFCADVAGPRAEQPVLTPRQAATLRLLAIGHTDESIAKRLGLSDRTVRRIVTDLMRRLDARSRFEAGVRAVQIGWLAVRTG